MILTKLAFLSAAVLPLITPKGRTRGWPAYEAPLPLGMTPESIAANGHPTSMASPRKPVTPVSHLGPRIGSDLARIDFDGARIDPQTAPRHGKITTFERGAVPPAVKVLGVRDGVLRIGFDAARIGPRTVLEAAGQFSDLIRAAIQHDYFESEVRFSDLAGIYALISEQFEWPDMKDKRLSMLLVSCGAERFTRTKKRQKFKVFRFETLQ